MPRSSHLLCHPGYPLRRVGGNPLNCRDDNHLYRKDYNPLNRKDAKTLRKQTSRNQKYWVEAEPGKTAKGTWKRSVKREQEHKEFL
jgi:hypothetical protein